MIPDNEAGKEFIVDERPIGVFDSGLGGLTMVKKLTEFLPGEDIIYLGDTGRVPYGPRSRETIVKYACQDAAFLAGYDIKTMVVACNTVCSAAIGVLKCIYNIPVYEVVSTPVKAAASCTRNRKIGIIGTKATIRSGAYETALKKISSDLSVYSVPCPLFVPLVEEGWIGPADEAALNIARRYLDSLVEAQIDTLILGCTHYPLLRDVIAKVMGPEVMLIDSGAKTAELVAADLCDRGMLSENGTGGTIKYFVTDSIEGFSKIASLYLESDVHGMVEQVALE